MEWEAIQEQVWPTTKSLVAPAMATSLVVMLVVRWLGGPRVGSLATVLAVAAAAFVGGVYVSNAVSEQKPWQLDTVSPLNENDLRRALALSLEEKPKPEENAEMAPEADPPLRPMMPLYWLPFLAGLAMLVEFVPPLLAVPAGPGWAVRTFIALFAGRLLSPNEMRMIHPWVSWALGLAILLEWALLTSLARRWLDGVVATGLGICCVTATMVLMLIANYASAYHLALLFGAALAGPALIAWKWPSDTSPAAAATAVALPSLLLVGYFSLPDPPPPVESFLLAGLAPLALLPVWLPFLARRERWTRWLLGLTLPLIPAVLAVVLAAQAE